MDSGKHVGTEQTLVVGQNQEKIAGVELELETSTFSSRTTPQSNTQNSLALTGLSTSSTSTTMDTNEPMNNKRQQQQQARKTPAKRPFDIVIFAASSSVGRFLVEELALVVDKYYPSQQTSQQAPGISSAFTRDYRDPVQFAQTSNEIPSSSRKLSVPRHVDGIKWAVAGRSAMKLNETLCRAELSTGIKDLSNQVPVILADLNHDKSLLDMCAKTQLIINCAGPYSVHGETVIKACLETDTNYIDLCHETSFIERMRRDYNDKARKNGVYIINGCGFQSMSAEMGLNFMKQVADGQIEEVKIILNLNDTKALAKHSSGQTYQCGIITSGMWSSLIAERSADESPGVSIHRLVPGARVPIESTSEENGDNGEAHEHKRLLQRKDTQSLVRDVVQLRNKDSFAWLQLLRGIDQAGKGYCMPIGSLTSEELQLTRGEMTNYELRKPDLSSSDGWRPIRCSSFLSTQLLSEVILLVIWYFIFNFLVQFSLARRIMKSTSSIFSLGNVHSNKGRELDRDSLNHIKFCQTYLAYGTPSDDSGDPMEQRAKHKKRKQELILVSRVVGPEPNHVATASYAIQAALTVVIEAGHLPDKGGVMTPGAAFSETNIIYQLRRRNLKFEVLKKA